MGQLIRSPHGILIDYAGRVMNLSTRPITTLFVMFIWMVSRTEYHHPGIPEMVPGGRFDRSRHRHHRHFSARC